MKTGWIIEIVKGVLVVGVGRTFFGGNSNYATLILAETLVLDTRRDARNLVSRDEVVRKVELDELGRATHIIPGR